MSAQTQEIQSRLNWHPRRILGANDGIVSTADIVVQEFRGAAFDRARPIGLRTRGRHRWRIIHGGRRIRLYVSTQRDAELAAIEQERQLHWPSIPRELVELRSPIEGRGVEANLAQQVAIQLTERDPLAAHAHWELGIDPDELVNPWHAAFASMLSFIAYAIIPLSSPSSSHPRRSRSLPP